LLRSGWTPARVGTIQVGKRADLVLIALDEVTTRLCGSDGAAVVNNGGAAGVDTVFIDGRVKK
jgi:5-methylthioadenosine/S-adenosylhomocysteine deaminase